MNMHKKRWTRNNCALQAYKKSKTKKKRLSIKMLREKTWRKIVRPTLLEQKTITQKSIFCRFYSQHLGHELEEINKKNSVGSKIACARRER
jgi:hypothetical protein